MNLALVKTPAKELNSLELALLSELQAAHLIIDNAARSMILSQRLMWQSRNREQGLMETDPTRQFERLEVMKMANRKVLA